MVITQPTHRPSARIAADLGLVKDRTAIVATDIGTDGRLEILHVEILQGTRQAPVDLIDVEQRIARLAQLLGTKHVALDSVAERADEPGPSAPEALGAERHL